MNVVWDSDGSHSFLTWSSSEWAFSLKSCLLEKKVRMCHRLVLSCTQVPKEHSKYSKTQPRLYKWDWDELLFSACPFPTDPLRFPRMDPQSSSSFVVAVIANCSVFPYWEEYLEYLRLLTTMWEMGAPNSEEQYTSQQRSQLCSRNAAAGLEGEIKDEGPCFPAVADRRGGWCRAGGLEGARRAVEAAELPLNAADAQLWSLLLFLLQLCSSWSWCWGREFACLTSFSQF